MLEQILRGAQQRAQSLGYEIEVHRVGAVPRRAERLRQILLARGQWGFIIPPVPKGAERLGLDMRGLAGVTIGTSLLEPSLHRVTTNHFRSGQLAYKMLQARGFKSIGLALSPSMNERVHGQWLGGYLSAHYTRSPAPVLPPLLVDETGRARFSEWFLEYKPDAILLAETLIAGWVAGCTPPDQPSPALGWLALTGHPPGVWGLDYQAERIGAAAVDMVVAQIHRNETGSPVFAHTLMLDSIWTEG
jgi:DNA-binding LacI/PurR family transcriptional regulator